MMQPVVRLHRHADGCFGIHLLRTRSAMRQHLHVDSRLIHLAKPQFAEIKQTTLDIGNPLAFPAGKHGDEVEVPVMLFKCNDERLVV